MAPVSVLSSDPIMLRLIEKHDPPKIGKTPIFISLIRAVISQQLSDAAASTIFKRLKDQADIAPNTLIDLDIEAFRSCGISKAKTGYIKLIAEATLAGHLENIELLPDDEVIKALTNLKGVGCWTAEMILIFALGREDVWPSDDAGLIRAAKRLYGIQSVVEFIALGDRFKPYRSLAAWYLWCSLDSKT
jgi:DNA-3-methyladenine glycosylase II